MPRRFVAAAFGALSMVLLPDCAATAPPPAPTAQLKPPPGPEARFHAVLINGGGNPDINFQPHLLHLEAMRQMLLASGVRPDRIAVFNGDGDDPAADFVSRAEQPEKDFWLLRDTRLGGPLQVPRVTASSTIPGVHLQPATKDALKKWFDEASRSIAPGDTVFLYVTDHGNRSGPDPMTNTIQLWGKDQLSVKELGDLVHELPAGVRVVSLMSQCFSGGFAELSTSAGTRTTPGAPAGARMCGYFSSTADRPAYGCFPENVGKERVGHSFQFLRSLATDRRMSEAHEESLVDDDTPDVPLRSSDALLEEILANGAKERSITEEALAAELLGPSWRDKPAWQAERALVDRIAGEYGMVSPRSLTDIEAQRDELTALGKALGSSAGSWGAALNEAAADNLDRFVAANPAWKDRLSDEAIKNLSPGTSPPTPTPRQLTASLLAELVPWTHKEQGDRLDVLEHKRVEADEAEYRVQVRIAVALRLEVILTSMAGRAYLDRYGSKAQRDDYAALHDCEELELPGGPASLASAANAPSEPALTVFPSIESERSLEHELHPAWLGITFVPVRDDVRAEHALPSGASLVTGVYPTSPAKAGGIQVGDLIVGAPGRPFIARGEIRTWTMLASVGEPHPLDIVRDGKPVELAIALRPHPGPMPPPPPPDAPAIGAAAPPVNLRRYRGGEVNLKDGRPHLLLFWATWCHFCKASLPEVLAFARERNVQVVAITDEPPATLDAFFAQWKDPFPKTVAIDDLRASFSSYVISALPGFVLVDGKGIVKARGIGYSRPPGLPIDGWKWSDKGEKHDKGAKTAPGASTAAKHADVLGVPQGPNDHAQ